MNHAITWASLFGVGFILAGLVCIGGGALGVFAGGMSDAPQAGADASRIGCIVGAAGIALVALGLWLVY